MGVGVGVTQKRAKEGQEGNLPPPVPAKGSQPDKSGGDSCSPGPQKEAGQLGRLRGVPGLLVSGRGRPAVLGRGSSSA